MRKFDRIVIAGFIVMGFSILVFIGALLFQLDEVLYGTMILIRWITVLILIRPTGQMVEGIFVRGDFTFYPVFLLLACLYLMSSSIYALGHDGNGFTAILLKTILNQ